MIKIAHLYYDLLNLYGEQGNILALVNAFKNQNIEVEIENVTINDKINFKAYDLIYMGTGSYENLMIVLEDLKKYKKEFKKYIEDEKYLIATGNSYLLFGKSIDDKEGLNIFSYYAKKTDRIRCHTFFEYLDLSPIIGFQNREFIVDNKENHLFKVIKGYGDNFKTNYEGYHYKNFIGTFTIGPLLIRNPHFTDLIVAKLAANHNYNYHLDLNTNEYKAYNEYLKNFYEK